MILYILIVQVEVVNASKDIDRGNKDEALLPGQPGRDVSWPDLRWTLLQLHFLPDRPQQLPLYPGTLSSFPTSQ